LQEYTFTVNGLNGCTATISVASGSTSSFDQPTNNSFTIAAQDVPQNIVIQVTVTGVNCPSNKTFDIPVLSVQGLAPNISGCPGSLVAGKSHGFELNATLIYPHNGSGDPDEVNKYIWTIESGGFGWTYSLNFQQGIENKLAYFNTNNCDGAVIAVYGISHCNRISSIQRCTIQRKAETPFIVGQPGYIICSDTDAIALTANQSTPGLSGYTYVWNDGDWTGSSASNFAIVTPSGTTPGVISVASVACAGEYTSTAASLNIPLFLIDTTTKVIGDLFVCNSEQRVYKLDIMQEPETVTTWAVTPTNAVVTATGSGELANLVASNNYNGKATIVFDIQTECGLAQRSKEVFVGLPKIVPKQINGQPLQTMNWICPNSGLGSHWVSVDLVGDEDNCVDSWMSSGEGTVYSNCKEFNFTLLYNPYSNPPYYCVFLTATASNRCGSVNYSFVICPSNDACRREGFEMHVWPNPVFESAFVTVEVIDPLTNENVELEDLSLMDQSGNLLGIQTAQGIQSELNTSGLKPGIYFISTMVQGDLVVKQLIVK